MNSPMDTRGERGMTSPMSEIIFEDLSVEELLERLNL